MSTQITKITPCCNLVTLPFVFAGCLLVEMATGQPLFPGKTDIDQLWLIAKLTGYLTPQQLHHVQSAPGTACFKMPIRQMRDTFECRFPRLTYEQLQVVKVQTCASETKLLSATFTTRSVAVVKPTCRSAAAVPVCARLYSAHYNHVVMMLLTRFMTTSVHLFNLAAGCTCNSS